MRYLSSAVVALVVATALAGVEARTAQPLDCARHLGTYVPGADGTLALCERDGLTIRMYARP